MRYTEGELIVEKPERSAGWWQILAPDRMLIAKVYHNPDTITLEPVYAEANATELVRRWNAFEEGGSHKALVEELEMLNQCFKCKYGYRAQSRDCPGKADGELPCSAFEKEFNGQISIEAALAQPK